jgi:hypothetical protein
LSQSQALAAWIFNPQENNNFRYFIHEKARNSQENDPLQVTHHPLASSDA